MRRDLDRRELRELVDAHRRRPRARGGRSCADGVPERHFEQLWRDDHVDVWVISWMNGNDTGFHDHDVSSGAVAVVEGEIIEERLVVGGPPRRLPHAAGETFDFDASHVHRMRQDSDAPAVSIHAYSPPLWRMGTYATGPRRHAAPGVDLLRGGAASGRRGGASDAATCVVIGGGVMGLFTAYHASERGAPRRRCWSGAGSAIR